MELLLLLFDVVEFEFCEDIDDVVEDDVERGCNRAFCKMEPPSVNLFVVLDEQGVGVVESGNG